MVSFIRFLIRFRWLVLVLCLVITLLALGKLQEARIGSSMGELLFGENPEYETYLERSEEFAGDEVLVVVIEDVDILAEQTITRIEAAAELIERIEEVDEVQGVHSAQHVAWSGGTLEAQPYTDEALDNPEDRAEILEALKTDPLSSGLYVSDDSEHTLLFVELTSAKDRQAERMGLLVGEVLDVLSGQGFPPEQLRASGFVATSSALVGETNYGLQRIFPFVIVALFAVVFLLFRRFWPVLVSMGIAMLGVIWTMGFAMCIDPQINVMMVVVPTVILIVAFSDVIHLCSAYLLELEHGYDKKDAIERSAAEVGKACLYTSVTTFFGFVAMSFVPTPMFRKLGVILGFGVAIALLLAVTIVPIIFSLMRRPKPWRQGSSSRVQQLVDRMLAGIAALTTARPWAVIAAFGVALALTFLGLSMLRIETSFTERLHEKHEVRQAQAFVKDHFASTHMLDLYVELPEAEDLFDPDLFAGLVAFQSAVEEHPEVDAVYSVVDLLQHIHAELNKDFPDAPDLPDKRAMLAQYSLLFEMAGGEGLERFVDFDRRVARLGVRLEGERMRESYETAVELAALAGEHLPPEVQVKPSGLLYLGGDWLDDIVAGQKRGLIFTFITVTLMMILALRSLRGGLGSMIPNALPLLALGAWLGFATDIADSDTIIVAMLAIGIGVDDTIHFLMRYRIELQRNPDRAAALKRCFDFAGRAIVMTTVTLAIGFAPMAASRYLSLAMLGTLLPGTLVVALLADLFLVPAMAQVGWLGDLGVKKA